MLGKYGCVVVANGLFPSGKLALQALGGAECVVACDGAVIALEKVRVPDVVVGDLDSLPEEVRRRYAGRLYRVEDQETNDLTKAMAYVKAAGFREVLILGATGLREDHTLGNISLLMRFAEEFRRVEMLSDFGLFTPWLRTGILASRKGQQVSLFSMGGCGTVSVRGLRYPIENRCLTEWWEGTLNEALGDEFEVILKEGAKVLVYRAF